MPFQMPPPPVTLNSASKIPIRSLYRQLSHCHQSVHHTAQDHCHMTLNQRIKINVSGHVHETFTCVLENFPDTLLGDAKRRIKHWDDIRKEYYFDAHQRSFEAIFQFYQTGYLRRPAEVPLQTFLEQLEIFELDKETMRLYCIQEGILKVEETPEKTSSVREEIWNIFEYPTYSRASFIVSVMSMTMIIFSVVLLCMTTLPSVHVESCKTVSVMTKEGKVIYKKVMNFQNEFFLLEVCCIAWYTVEYIVRFITCPHKLIFLKDYSNMLDLIAIFPYYIFLSVLAITDNCKYVSKGNFLFLLRILRILRIFKLTRHNRSLRLLRQAFYDSFYGLIACFFIITMTALIFAAIIYWVEIDLRTSHFQSMEEALWWAFATMTTVGYGDVVPQTRAGKAVGTVCIVVGTVVLALPAPIIVTNFNRYYRNETGRGLEEAEMKRS